MASTNSTSPLDFGMPGKYADWRDGQEELFWDLLDSKTRFSIHNAPVGMGKSLCYTCVAQALGGRTAILTATKPLQDQLGEFAQVGMYDMRGLSNYPCKALAEGGPMADLWHKRFGKPMCDMGPCTSGVPCGMKDNGCNYFDSYKAANGAQVVQTNFAYWIAIHKYGQGLGKFDRLFIDEVHESDSQLSSALSVEYSEKEYRELGAKPPKANAPLTTWRMWASVQLRKVQARLEMFTEGARMGQVVGEDGLLTLIPDNDLPDATEMKMWKRLEGKCMTLADASDDWIIGTDEKSGNVKISPAWVRNYAESHLFLNIPRVGMLSGTVRPKIADLTGLSDGSWTFKEYPSTFPVSRRPIYWVPTVRLGYNTTEEDLMKWVLRIDQLIYKRLDRKGLIHTVSYPRQKFLLQHSKFAKLMHANSSGNTKDVVQSFKNAKAPAILVSPSIGTGFDFAFDLARYQIISKVPFRDQSSPLLKIQSAQDPEYQDYLTAQDLVQMYGRSNRDPEDFSETFVVDDHFWWFKDRKSKKGESFFPQYFLEAVQRCDGIPMPPPLSEIQRSSM